MRRSMLAVMLGSVLLGAAAAPAHAQYRDRGYGNGRDTYGYNRGGEVIARVMSDVQRVGNRGAFGGVFGNRGNSNRDQQRAMDELSRFDQRLREGNWDQGRLDKAIERVSALANSNNLDNRERQMMYSDANLLREFRATRGNTGGYNTQRGPYNNGPYYGR